MFDSTTTELIPTKSFLFDLRAKIASLICPEQVEQRDRLEREARTDALTGVANRRALTRARVVAEADPDTSFILFDANNFGQVNKIAGLATGDECLIGVAGAIKAAAARHGFSERVFRLGGDEFVVLSPASLAGEIRDTAEAEFGVYLIGDYQVSLSGSIGRTLAEADRLLQARKAEAKGEVN